MAAFWLGTVPVLAGLGLVAQHAIAPLRRRLPAISAAALIVVGLLTITGKFHAASGGAVCHSGRMMSASAAAHGSPPTSERSGTPAPAPPDHDHGDH
jgi:sulfite exporter TauE/SafE